MLFLKSVPLSRSLNLLTCNISAKRARMICLVVFFAAVLASLLVRLERNGAEAQSFRSRQTQGSLSHSPPNLDETYANAAMGSPRKEYSLSGSSLAAAQGIVVINPSAYQTPDLGQGGEAVSSPSNTGHASTGVSGECIEGEPELISQTVSCRWFGFPAVNAGKLSVKLKIEDASSGILSTRYPASNTFKLSYSLDGGSSWTNAVSRSNFTSSQSGAFTLDLPISQDLTQVQVRDFLRASAGLNGSAGATATVSNIRIEVDTVNCTASVPGDRWRGEYYNNQTLSGSPAMVRDDGTGFLNFDFGLGSPGASCGLGADNFSARWTRSVSFGPGIYRFPVTGDDGVRLYVDGQLKIDKWFSQGATTYTADVTLSAGNHEVKLEYFESGGPGVALLSWTALAGLSCLPDVSLIGAVPRTGEGDSVATTAISRAPKRCGLKQSDQIEPT